jgi:hypothetical protein
MAWNGTTPNAPNWQGDVSGSGGDGGVGDLYILPDPPSIAENPSIGLEGRNEVPLPTKYKDFDVDNLTATNINGNPNYDASNWWRYPANGNVTATLNPLFDAPQWDISGFEQISCVTLNTTQNVECGNTINAVLGNIGGLNCPDILMSPGDKVARLDCYGTNLVAGDNALYVEGGTTLTGGGIVHGVTIGALQVAGLDTNRIDVVPLGIDISTLTTPIAIQSGVICSVSGGAFLSLAGGDYIQYSSDQHYFVNGVPGVSDDFTDIYVGNIHAAFGGTAPLRINDAGRGVELANVNSISMTTQLPIADWSGVTAYGAGDKVKLSNAYYNCVVGNTNTPPNAPIPDWVSAATYDVGNVVFSDAVVFRCSSYISGSTTPPDPTGDPNWDNLGFTTNLITQIWAVFNPYVANITGDTLSNITIGKITAPVDYVKIAGTGLRGNTGLETITNVQAITLTTTAESVWSAATAYADNVKVGYGVETWVSQIANNIGNIPAASLEDWISLDPYIVGNVRYDNPDGNAYICILAVSGSTPPSADPTHWSFFQLGNNGEDVWYPFTAPVISTIAGDRLSAMEIGTIACINGLGSYLEITNAIDGEPPDANSNALISSAGALALAGTTAVQVVAQSGDVTIGAPDGDVNILSTTSNIQIGAEDPANGVVAINGKFAVGIISDNTINLESQGLVSITAITTDISLTAGNNINLTAGAGDKVIVNSTLDLTDKNVINADTITGQGALTLATTGATNLNLSPDTGGLIVANKGVNLSNNNITNANTITGQGALTLVSTGANNINLSPSTGNRVNVTTDAQFNNRTLYNFTGTNVGGIYGMTTAPLALVGQQATPQINLRGATTMWATASVQAPGNSIAGVTTLNGRNIFSYGNFYNTASQTLGAINTATRVVMNTSANNNLITLDTTTNIGRITFTNAGVYKVVWNAYLLHGTGGPAKSCIWIRLNGTDVAGSGKTENNDSQLNETNLTSSSLINATAGQYIEFFWASDSTNVPLTAVAASAPFPLTPSFNVTISIVG